ncbi:DUF4160 domain-containing protein [Desulfobulbus sp. F4]|nr:DUF4160 domain-containing protein [Desulfobulbus sp. F3]MCW5200488.1 DUF4160 domain-containing protein [Desulfobulbus sp. F4]
MPIIARFYGMIIKMYFQQSEHSPPHIHAVYGEYVGAVDIRTLDMLEGDLPSKALTLVQEWTKLHQTELLAMWDLQKFNPLPPLE